MTSTRTTPAPGAARRRRADRIAGALADEYLGAIEGGDREAAEGVARRALGEGLALADVHALVIAPAMRRVGEHWESGTFTVADEHLATAISEAVTAAIYPEGLEALPGGGETVLLAAVEGEQHALGLRMAGDVLEGRGHVVRMLGADVPLVSLLGAVERWRPDVVGLTVAIPSSAEALVESLLALGERGVRVVVGGGGVPAAVRDCGVPCIESVNQIPLGLDELAPAETWHERLRATAPTLTRPPAAAVEARSELESTLARTASEVGDLARTAMRERYVYERLASIDPVTDLPNRRAWDEELESAAGGEGGCVAMVDVDRFKELNDRLGHAGGDRVLSEVGGAIAGALRAGDFVARFGGDEFAILLRGAAPAEGIEVAGRIRAAVERALSGEVTLSIGVAALGADWRAGTLAADRALYEAKSGGRNRVVGAAE